MTGSTRDSSAFSLYDQDRATRAALSSMNLIRRLIAVVVLLGILVIVALCLGGLAFYGYKTTWEQHLEDARQSGDRNTPAGASSAEQQYLVRQTDDMKAELQKLSNGLSHLTEQENITRSRVADLEEKLRAAAEANSTAGRLTEVQQISAKLEQLTEQVNSSRSWLSDVKKQLEDYSAREGTIVNQTEVRRLASVLDELTIQVRHLQTMSNAGQRATAEKFNGVVVVLLAVAIVYFML